MADLPRLFGKYEISGEIARGGFATVYRALDTDLERDVALKVLAPHLTWEANFTARFQQEAKVAARLKHSSIVTIYEIGEVDGALFIAMELAQAGSLRDRLAAMGELDVGETIKLLGPIAAALDFAHAHGIIHRDIKPANILLESDEYGGVRPILTDFGLVKALANSAELTQSGAIIGTVEYMAPEQADTDLAHEIGPASDIYALGIVAYHMLTGRVPFSDSSAARVLMAHLTKQPPPPSSIRTDLPPGVSDAILRALAKQPADRYPSASAFVDALREAEQARKRATTISDLYDQAQIQVNEQAWEDTLNTMSAIRQLDPDFGDPSGLTTRAEKALRRSEQTKRLQSGSFATIVALTNALHALPLKNIGHSIADASMRLAAYPIRLARRVPSAVNWKSLVVVVLLIIVVGSGYAIVSNTDDIAALVGIRPVLPTLSGNTLFTSDRSGKQEIHYLDSKGETTRMTNTPGNSESWSPSLAMGGSIYFTSNRSGKREIHRLDSLGKTVRMTNTPANGESWSPSISLGGAIYFTSNRDGKQEIYRLNSLGETVRMTNTPANGESWSPSSSVDGAVYFTSNRDGKREIYRLNSLGETVRMTNTPGSSHSWSPSSSTDGSVYFTSNRDGGYEIYRLGSSDGTTRMTHTADTVSSWSPIAASGAPSISLLIEIGNVKSIVSITQERSPA